MNSFITKQLKLYLFLILAFCLSSIHLSAQQWQTLGTGSFSTGVADYVDMAIHATTGEVYVTYSDGNNVDKIHVKRFDGTNWVTVGSAGFSAGAIGHQSIAFDNTGTPYVAYQDLSFSRKVTVQKFNGTNWVAVGSAGFTSGWSQGIKLMMDGATPFLGYTDLDDGDKLSVMTFNGSNWTYVGNQAFSPDAYYEAFGMENGNLFAVYTDNPNSNLNGFSYNGSSWNTLGAPSFAGNVNSSVGMDVYNGEPYVSFDDGANSDKASVMKYDGSSWVNVGAAGFTSSDVAYVEILVEGGTPYVVFLDYSLSSKASVMTYDGSSWTLVGAAGISQGEAYYKSLVIHNGVLYLAYQDVGNSAKGMVKKYDLNVNIQKIQDLNNLISIYPNPSKDLLNIQSEHLIESVSILSLTGQVLKVENESSISIKELVVGSYLIEVKTAKGLSHKLFTKN
jgi:hypothetical protein